MVDPESLLVKASDLPAIEHTPGGSVRVVQGDEHGLGAISVAMSDNPPGGGPIEHRHPCARSYGVNRTTIINHLDQQGVPRRRVVRKMTDTLVAEAALMYIDGHSLKAVADDFKVDTRTLGRELRKAGIPIRPRRGWLY